MSYFDENGLIRAQPNEPADNAFLYAMYLKTLDKTKISDMTLANAVMLMEKKPGEYSQRIQKTIEEDRASHDEISAIMCFLLSIGACDQINRLKTRYYPHPRDFVFYNYLKHPFIWGFLLWVTSLSMIWTCNIQYRTKEGRIDTDGKLLAWLRFSWVNMPITKFFCELGLKKRFGKDYARVLLTEYFWDQPNHPLRKL